MNGDMKHKKNTQGRKLTRTKKNVRKQVGSGQAGKRKDCRKDFPGKNKRLEDSATRKDWCIWG